MNKLTLSFIVVLMLPSASWSQDDGELLRGFTSAQQASMRAACRVDGFSGPASLYRCLQIQVTALQNSPGEPDLSAFTSEQQESMRRACRVDGFSGPASLYACLRKQVTALQNSPGEPDLSAFTREQQESMRRACRVDGFSGPASLYACLRRQVTALQNSPGEPDLSAFTPEQQESMRRACRVDGFSGPASLYACLRKQVTALLEVVSPSRDPGEATRKAASGDAGAALVGSRRGSPIASAPQATAPMEPRSPSAPPSAPATSPIASEARNDQASVRLFWVAILIGVAWWLWRSSAEKRQQWAEARAAAARDAEAARRRAEEERLQALKTMESLQLLSGSGFEDVVGTLFTKLGCQVARTRATGDQGIDLVVHCDGAKLVVQCKRWKADIGEPIIRDFFGSLMHARAAHGFVITTARFTKKAVRFSRGKPLTLINGDMLLKWIAGSYQPSVRGYAPQGNPKNITEPVHGPYDQYV